MAQAPAPEPLPDVKQPELASTPAPTELVAVADPAPPPQEEAKPKPIAKKDSPPKQSQPRQVARLVDATAAPKKKQRVERIDSAEIEALIEADRQRNAQSAQATPVKAEAVTVASGWMPGSVPAPGTGLSQDTWKGARQ
jgi:hypothetical protein